MSAITETKLTVQQASVDRLQEIKGIVRTWEFLAATSNSLRYDSIYTDCAFICSSIRELINIFNDEVEHDYELFTCEDQNKKVQGIAIILKKHCLRKLKLNILLHIPTIYQKIPRLESKGWGLQ